MVKESKIKKEEIEKLINEELALKIIRDIEAVLNKYKLGVQDRVYIINFIHKALSDLDDVIGKQALIQTKRQIALNEQKERDR